MMNVERLRYELRIMGLKVLLPPLLIIVLFALLGILLHWLGVKTEHVLIASQEMFLPLVVGGIVAATSLSDAALEVQLTLPGRYQRTAVKRLGIVLVWSICLALLTNTGMFVFHLGYLPDELQSWPVLWQFLGGQLIWLAPLCWFISVGLCLTLVTHSITTSGAVLGGLWILEALFIKTLLPTNPWLQAVTLFTTSLMPEASFWLSNRLELLLTALLLLPINWLLLRNTESILKGAKAE